MRAQVAELQHERARPRRVVSTPTLDLGLIHSGAAGSGNASDMMQNLIDAADSTLKEVRSA